MTSVENLVKIEKWNNEDNASYYEKVPIEEFRQYAIQGGFEKGCDINLIYAVIQNTQSLLEVGAGYGRVFNCLLERGYQGDLIAIERSENFCNYLRETFEDKVKVIQADAEKMELNFKVDVVLWMWSNISEWPKGEQFNILSRLVSLCKKPAGFFIMETIDPSVKPNNVSIYQENTYMAQTDYGRVYGYNPTPDEIKAYAQRLEVLNFKQISYQTDTGRPRIIYIFEF